MRSLVFSVNQESLLREDGRFYPLDFTPSILHRQGSEIAGHAKPRPNRLGSVKRSKDIQQDLLDEQKLCSYSVINHRKQSPPVW